MAYLDDEAVRATIAAGDRTGSARLCARVVVAAGLIEVAADLDLGSRIDGWWEATGRASAVLA
ncbi:hypothetical protein [Mycolicibacterium sp. XJ870]